VSQNTVRVNINMHFTSYKNKTGNRKFNAQKR